MIGKNNKPDSRHEYTAKIYMSLGTAVHRHSVRLLRLHTYHPSLLLEPRSRPLLFSSRLAYSSHQHISPSKCSSIIAAEQGISKAMRRENDALCRLVPTKRASEMEELTPSKRRAITPVNEENGFEPDLDNDDNADLGNEEASSHLSTPVVENEEDNLKRILALKEDGSKVDWENLSDAVKDAVRAAVRSEPDWYGKVLRSTKNCLAQRTMAEHVKKGREVACKQCAFQHKLCIKKLDHRVVLTPLCALDQDVAKASFDDVGYFRLSDDVRLAPSKTSGDYPNIIVRK